MQIMSWHQLTFAVIFRKIEKSLLWCLDDDDDNGTSNY